MKLVEIWLPYGETEVVAKIPAENLLSSIRGAALPNISNPHQEITRAINNPIGGKKLHNIVDPDDTVAIVIEDEIFLSNLLIPLIQKLEQLGIPNSNVTVILGNTLQADMPSIAMSEFAKGITIIPAYSAEDEYSYVGDTSRRTKIYLNKAYVDADFRILTGRIRFHPYFGYIGGRSGVFPAICSPVTVRQLGPLLLNPHARSGNLEGNPLHLEMEEAAHMAQVDFILNLVVNAKHEIAQAFAGDLDQAFLEGKRLVDESFLVSSETRSDIAVLSSGGAPYDLTLYRACEALPSALNIVKNGGVIVWIAECSKGTGSSVFSDWMAHLGVLNKIKTEMQRRYVLGGEMTHLLLSALQKTKIILVSSIPDYYAAGVFRLRTARTVNTAVNSAFRLLGKSSKVLVLPTGTTILPKLKRQT
jgi:nickel-dependent lactate racemase